MKTVAAILALVVALGVAVGPTEAQTRLDAEVPEADHSFGQRITFRLRATAPDLITAINLFFEIEGRPGTTALPVDVAPASRISIDYAYSPSGQDVPPFATITYWWTIRDEAGQELQTEKKSLYYADNRYEWKGIKDQRQGSTKEVYWVQGDVAFGQRALNIAVEALGRISRELQVDVPGIIRIFVYPSEQDLQSALGLAGYDWAGGQARPELDAILVGIPDGPAAPGEMERLLPHELTHLLVYVATGSVPGRVPPWLDEGLASLNEQRPDPQRQTLLDEALSHNRLFRLEALCAPFPEDRDAALLAYAQSASIVSYLRDAYGTQLIRDLLAAYADDASCEAGVTKAVHKSLSGLDSAWRASLTNQGQIVAAVKESSPWLALWLLSAVLVLPLLGVLKGRRRQTQ